MSALAQSVGIGFTNLVFTFVGLWLIDRLGRRTLLYIGSFGYILSLGLCGVAFFTWAPQFKAASAAVDVKAAVGSLSTADPARIAALTAELESKKKSLAAATAVPASGAQAVEFPADTKLDAVKAIANTALEQASQRPALAV